MLNKMIEMFKGIEFDIGTIIGLAITIAFFGYMSYIGIKELCEWYRTNKKIKKENLIFKSYYEKMIPQQCSKCKWARKEYVSGSRMSFGKYKPVYCKKFRKSISLSDITPRCNAYSLASREWELLVRKNTNHQ